MNCILIKHDLSLVTWLIRFENSLRQYLIEYQAISHREGGWGSGGAMVLGKLSMPGQLTNLDNSRARAYCACTGCG